MSKDPCRPHTGNTQWSMWVCLLTWDCLLHYNFHNMAYKKKFNLVKWGVELKMNWLNWSIPISSGFQFQFNSNSKSFNSIPIQFMLNWIELIINSNSIHELIRALCTVRPRNQACGYRFVVIPHRPILPSSRRVTALVWGRGRGCFAH